MSLQIDLVSTDEESSDYGLTEDEKFARKLQKEFDAEDRSVEEFECPICFDRKPIDSKFIYQECEHEQCRECASEFFTRQIQLKNQINCVLCQKEVSTLDLELVLPLDSVNKYLKDNGKPQIEENHRNNHNGHNGNDTDDSDDNDSDDSDAMRERYRREFSGEVSSSSSSDDNILARRNYAFPTLTHTPFPPIVVKPQAKITKTISVPRVPFPMSLLATSSRKPTVTKRNPVKKQTATRIAPPTGMVVPTTKKVTPFTKQVVTPISKKVVTPTAKKDVPQTKAAPVVQSPTMASQYKQKTPSTKAAEKRPKPEPFSFRDDEYIPQNEMRKNRKVPNTAFYRDSDSDSYGEPPTKLRKTAY